MFALVCLFIAFAAGLYLGVRLADRAAYITVSPHGAVVCGEVVTFSSEKGDVDEVFAFDDAYLVRLCRSGVFGFAYNSELLLPAGGAVRKGLDMTADEAVCAAFVCRRSPRWRRISTKAAATTSLLRRPPQSLRRSLRPKRTRRPQRRRAPRKRRRPPRRSPRPRRNLRDNGSVGRAY